MASPGNTEFNIKNVTFKHYVKKMHLTMSLLRCRPFCTHQIVETTKHSFMTEWFWLILTTYSIVNIFNKRHDVWCAMTMLFSPHPQRLHLIWSINYPTQNKLTQHKQPPPIPLPFYLNKYIYFRTKNRFSANNCRLPSSLMYCWKSILIKYASNGFVQSFVRK